MNLNINIAKNPSPAADPTAIGQVGTPAAPAASDEARAALPLFTVTRGAASPEDIQAANLPPDTLSRDDDLGRLVSAVFNLPPPPMPNF
ncbi:MAG: hypothetical protein IKQ55_07440 [Kiritimatiellae bacterium]|nr:hypothetical protein [Kiritimatiellia bacterium]